MSDIYRASMGVSFSFLHSFSLDCAQRRLALANFSCHFRDDAVFALDSLGSFSLFSKSPLEAMVVDVGRTYEPWIASSSASSRHASGRQSFQASRKSAVRSPELPPFTSNTILPTQRTHFLASRHVQALMKLSSSATRPPRSEFNRLGGYPSSSIALWRFSVRNCDPKLIPSARAAAFIDCQI